MSANPAVFSILSLPECQALPASDIGRRVAKLADLQRKQFPLPFCNVLTVPFLKELFLANQLEVRFRWLLEHLNWQDQQSLTTTSLELQTLIKQIHWPNEAQQNILKKHQEWMTDCFLAVRPSFVSEKSSGHFSLLDIQGEANLIESILLLWADFYQPEFLSQRWREWQNGIHIPAAILIQKMIPSTAAGFAQMYTNQKSRQPQATIYGVWGVATRQIRQKNMMDEFIFNLKSEQLISQHLNIKQHEYIHRLDQLDKKAVPYEKQAIACLGKAELKTLVLLLKRVHMTIGISPQELLEVEWAYDGKKFYLLHIQSKPGEHSAAQPALKMPRNLPTSQAAPQLAPAGNKIKVIVMNPGVAPTPPRDMTGVSGLCFQSDKWWADQSAHPKAMLDHGQAHFLKNRMLQTLSTYFQHQQGKQFWYQPQSLTTHQLLKLDRGAEYEEREINPWLGFRGGLRNLHQREIFDFELDILQDFSKEMNQPIELILPWVRSSTELQLLYKHITRAPAEQYHHLHIWMECATPENLLNIHQYAAVPITGIVVNLDSLYSLLFGLDPENANVLKYYSSDILLVHSLLKAVAKRLATFHKPMILKTTHSSHQIMSLLEDIGETGIMVLNTDLTSTLQFLQTG